MIFQTTRESSRRCRRLRKQPLVTIANARYMGRSRLESTSVTWIWRNTLHGEKLCGGRQHWRLVTACKSRVQYHEDVPNLYIRYMPPWWFHHVESGSSRTLSSHIWFNKPLTWWRTFPSAIVVSSFIQVRLRFNMRQRGGSHQHCGVGLRVLRYHWQRFPCIFQVTDKCMQQVANP